MPAKITDPVTYLVDRVVVDDGCWGWTGTVRKDNGYGQVPRHVFGTSCSHRAVYEFLEGPVPDGLELDHTCRNRWCVNPAHLEPVTHRENLLRGNTIAARANATHCQRGHEFTPDNTITRASRPTKRECRACAVARRQR